MSIEFIHSMAASLNKHDLRTFNVSGARFDIARQFYQNSPTLTMLADRDDSAEIYIPRMPDTFKRLILPILLEVHVNLKQYIYFIIHMECDMVLAELDWFGIDIKNSNLWDDNEAGKLSDGVSFTSRTMLDVFSERYWHAYYDKRVYIVNPW